MPIRVGVSWCELAHRWRLFQVDEITRLMSDDVRLLKVYSCGQRGCGQGSNEQGGGKQADIEALQRLEFCRICMHRIVLSKGALTCGKVATYLP